MGGDDTMRITTNQRKFDRIAWTVYAIALGSVAGLFILWAGAYGPIAIIAGCAGTAHVCYGAWRRDGGY